MTMKKNLLTALFLAGVAAGANAQLPLVGDLLGGGLPGLDGLPGLGALPDMGGVPLLGAAESGELINLGMSVLGDPQTILGLATGLGLPVAEQLIPVLEPLQNDPLSMLDYFLNGGALITDAISAIPEIPLVNAPLL